MASTGHGEILWHNTTMVWLQVLLTEAVCNTSCELYLPCMSSTSIVQYKKYCMQLVKVCLSYQICNCMPSDNRFQVKSRALCRSFWQVLCTLVHVRLYVWLHACICVHMCVCMHILDHHTLKEETKLNFIILFRNECSNIQISCMCVQKKVQTVKNKIKSKCQILLQPQMVEEKKHCHRPFSSNW